MSGIFSGAIIHGLLMGLLNGVVVNLTQTIGTGVGGQWLAPDSNGAAAFFRTAIGGWLALAVTNALPGSQPELKMMY